MRKTHQKQISGQKTLSSPTLKLNKHYTACKSAFITSHSNYYSIKLSLMTFIPLITMPHHHLTHRYITPISYFYPVTVLIGDKYHRHGSK